MNKKLIYLSAVLVMALFVVSACSQDAVGVKINKNKISNDKTLIGSVSVNCGYCTKNNEEVTCTATAVVKKNLARVECSPAEGCTGSCSESNSGTYD